MIKIKVLSVKILVIIMLYEGVGMRGKTIIQFFSVKLFSYNIYHI